MSANVTTTTSTAPAQAGIAGRVSSSVIVWLALVAYLVAAKLILGLLPQINIRQAANDFSWTTMIVFGTLGLVGVWLSERTGFPQALDPHISNRRRILFPLLVGVGLGLFAIVVDLVTGGTKFIEVQSGQPTFNVYFPASLLVYTGGIVVIEAFYLVLPLPLLLWLGSNVLLRGRGQTRVFWVLAISLSLMEPVLNGGLGILRSSDPLRLFFTIFLPYFATCYPFNLGQAIAFRKYGLLAPIAMRLGYYLMWHILYGNFIYPLVG